MKGMEERIEAGRGGPQVAGPESSRGKRTSTLLDRALELMREEGLTPGQATDKVGVSSRRRNQLISLLKVAQEVSQVPPPKPRGEAMEETRRRILKEG